MSAVLGEARRLHKLGFAIHWIMPGLKRPVESGWTTGERKPWVLLASTYKEGMNVGVRTGSASPIGKGFLACIDVDIKNPLSKRAALEKLRELTRSLGASKFPQVRSGSGGGSRHLYCLTAQPFKMITFVKNDDFEICIYSTGRQMVLPPSITKNQYVWKSPLLTIDDLPLVEFEIPEEEGNETKQISKTGKTEAVNLDGFQVESVDLSWVPISDKTRQAILEGVGITDRSGFLLKASTALLSAGLSQNEVLSVLTDPKTFLGAVGYDHAKTKSRKKAAEWVYKYTLKKVAKERSAQSIFKGVDSVPEPKKLSKAERKAQDAEMLSERSWKQDIIYGGQNGEGPPKSIVGNVVLILKNAVSPKVFLRNEFAVRDTYGVSTPWGGERDSALTDDDVVKVKYWLGQVWGFEPKNQVINDAMVILATENAFDPVRDFLEALPEWDEEPRLDTWLAKNFEAVGEPEYLAQVFRKWMVAMVMRVYKPGLKFDWMPILEGNQGVGKSSFGRLLVGDKFFIDWLPNLADKDSALALQGIWCVEMGELSQFRKNELENIKGFVTRTVDKVRPPYGQRWLESPRRCVFFGSTNAKKYLIDDTGNRRFKPCKVGALNFEALERDRLQLFAEAKYLMDQKIETERTLDLNGTAKVFEQKTQADKMVEDDSTLMLQVLRDFREKIDEEDVDFSFSKFQLHDLFQGAGPLLKWKFEQRNMNFAAKALKAFGAENWKSDGRKYWKLVQGPQNHQKGPLKNGRLPEETFRDSKELSFL